MITSNMLLTTESTTEFLQPTEIKSVTPKDAMIKPNATINPPIKAGAPRKGSIIHTAFRENDHIIFP